MAQDDRTSQSVSWLEASGLPHIFRILGFAVQPTRLALALAAIVLTLLVGWVLDAAWTAGGRGVSESAIAQFVRNRPADLPVAEPKGDRGIFSVWRGHELRAISSALHAVVPRLSVSDALDSLRDGAYGIWWMVERHPFYSLLYFALTLLIWSFFGGAICRATAVHFARDDRLSLQEAFGFSREKLVGGLFLAPCIPLVFILLAGLLMILGGALLRVPVLGDLICGAAFFLALIGGFVIAILLIGLVIGGPLLWPAVAAEGSDAFDAFSRSISYPFSKPWKTVLYGLLVSVYAGICWLFVSFFVAFMLRITHAAVSFGTAPFGWWDRGGEGMTKLDLIWPLVPPHAGYVWPEWGQLGWYEYISAFLIGIQVLAVVGLMWSFLVTFFLSGSTVVYFLLRRDVDGIDLQDVYTAEPPPEPSFAAPTLGPPSTSPTEGTTPSAGPADTAPPSTG